MVYWWNDFRGSCFCANRASEDEFQSGRQDKRAKPQTAWQYMAQYEGEVQTAKQKGLHKRYLRASSFQLIRQSETYSRNLCHG